MKKEAAILLQRFFHLQKSRKINDPMGRRIDLWLLFHRHLNWFRHNRNSRIPKDEADVRGAVDSYNDIVYKTERLRVRGRNFTHGVENMIKGIETFK